MKPKPPLDLWEKLEELAVDNNQARRPDEFTREDYAIRFNMSKTTASLRLKKLVAMKKITQRIISKKTGGLLTVFRLCE